MSKIVYLYEEHTGEYRGIYDAQPSPEEDDVYIIPTFSTEIPAPVVGEYEVAVFVAGNWTVVPDLRGRVIYDQTSGVPRIVEEMGPIAVGYGLQPPPPTPAQLTATALSHRDSLIALATTRIAPLQDAVDLEVATDAEGALLKAWKLYRIALNRVSQQASFPDVIVWPEEPSPV